MDNPILFYEDEDGGFYCFCCFDRLLTQGEEFNGVHSVRASDLAAWPDETECMDCGVTVGSMR